MVRPEKATANTQTAHSGPSVHAEAPRLSELVRLAQRTRMFPRTRTHYDDSQLLQAPHDVATTMPTCQLGQTSFHKHVLLHATEQYYAGV